MQPSSSKGPCVGLKGASRRGNLALNAHVERNGNGELSNGDVTLALDEMLVAGGTLNLKLLGATEVKEK